MSKSSSYGDANPSSERRVVALLLRNFHGGGAERSMINIANGLAEEGVDVDLVVMRGDGPFREHLSPMVEVVDLSCAPAGLSTAFAIGKVATYLRHRKPDRLVSTLEALSIVASISGVLTRRNSDIVLRVATTYDREPRPLLRRILIHILYKWHPGMFVTNSRGSAANLKASLDLPDTRIHVVNNAIDLESIYRLSMRQPEHLEVPPSPDRRFVLFVGRLAPAKRVDLLIHAFATVRESLDVDLIILGEGPLRESLTQLVSALGLDDCVHIPGFTSNPYAYMARAGVLVLSSAYEGMPTALIEALACGCPVVSTDCESGPREIVGGGRWGRLVPPGDRTALATAIVKTLEDPPSPIRLQNRAAYFSVSRVAKEYMQLLFPIHEPSVERHQE